MVGACSIRRPMRKHRKGMIGGSMSKEQRIRLEGARWCLELIESKGMEEAKHELKNRGVWGIPVSALDRSQVHAFTEEFKRQLCAITLLTLADGFDFDREQLIAFERRFNLKTDCIEDGITFEDYAQILREEYDLDVDKVQEWK